MSYIGASLVDVKAALKKRGRISLSGRREGHGWVYNIGGAGAVKLSIRLARQLINRWWASPAGTKIVLGFLTGKHDQVNVERHNFLPVPFGPRALPFAPKPSAIKVMEIVRPPRTPNANQPKAQNVFQRIVVEKMRRMGEHTYTNYADYEDEQRHVGLYSATWFSNPKAWPQPYIVWPSGILSNRNAEAVARVQKGWQILENTRHVLPNLIARNVKHYSNRWVTPTIFNARPSQLTGALSGTNIRPINVARRQSRNKDFLDAARRNGAAAAIQKIYLDRIYRPGGQFYYRHKNKFEKQQMENMIFQNATRKRKR